MHPLSLRSPWDTGAWLREVRPDVYLSPFYMMPWSPQCACVLTAHDVWPLRLKDPLSPWRALAVRYAFGQLRRAALILTSSEFSRGEIRELLAIPSNRVRTVPLGVPPRSAAQPSRPLRAPHGRFALVVGDNRPRKNLAVLARAWARWSEPPLDLIQAGPEDRRYETLESMARRAGARGIHTLGWVSEAELSWLYGNATLVLFPSRYEGFGFPLLEALARGVPAIAADIPTTREVAGDAVPVVDPDQDSQWAEAVARLASSQSDRGRYARAGLARAAQLDYRQTAARTLDELRGVAGTPRSHPRPRFTAAGRP